MIAMEVKLFFRDTVTWIAGLLLPTLILLILGALPGLRTPDAAFGGERFIDIFIPSLVVITLAFLGVNALPIRLASQRENGVLRRLSTTPAHPGRLLAAQVVVSIIMAFASVILLIGVGKLVFNVPLPQNGPGFVLAFLLGLTSTLAMGLLIAAVAPTARSGTAIASLMYFVIMFLGGVYLPRFFLPDLLVNIGKYTPPGVQPMFDTWMGAAPDPLQLIVLMVITVIASIGAARAFRWE